MFFVCCCFALNVRNTMGPETIRKTVVPATSQNHHKNRVLQFIVHYFRLMFPLSVFFTCCPCLFHFHFVFFHMLFLVVVVVLIVCCCSVVVVHVVVAVVQIVIVVVVVLVLLLLLLVLFLLLFILSLSQTSKTVKHTETKKNEMNRNKKTQ